MTKPAALLSRANRVLADDTNEPAVVDVTNFIQPVVDVQQLDTDLFVMSIDFTSTQAKNVIFRLGPVPRSEVWEMLEAMILSSAVGPFQWQVQNEWETDLGARRMAITQVESEMANPINVLRSSHNTGGAVGPEHTCDRPVMVYPGMTFAIHGNTAQAIGDITRFDFMFLKRVANTPIFQVNNNENVNITEI